MGGEVMYTMEEIFKLEEENMRKELDHKIRMAKEKNNQNVLNSCISLISQQQTNIMFASMLSSGQLKDK